VCGHRVYDDQESRCPLCACQEHKPRLPTAGDHTDAALVSSRAGEAWRGPQPELSGPSRCCLLQQHTSARNLCQQTLLAGIAPATRSGSARPWAVPGRTQPPCGRGIPGAGKSPPAPGIRPGCGRPRPSLPGVTDTGQADSRRHAAAVSAESRHLDLKRVQTEAASGLAASSEDSLRRHRPEPPSRRPAQPWQVTGVPGPRHQRHITKRVPVYQRVSRCVTTSSCSWACWRGRS
jgi:hypothetical protein